jgi:putative heme-binding domain-containing protein
MFSPVALRTGPDGALWVADMYRKVLEHPHWLPAGWEKSIDVRAGHDRGRIYRVFPTGKRPRPWPRLDRLDTAGLVALLESPSGWLRDKAQQMHVQRKDRSSVALLEGLLSKSARPLTRVHALGTLEGLGALRPEAVARGLADRHPGVRRHAARLSESPAARSTDAGNLLLKLVRDPDAAVRQQLGYSLGAWDSPAAARALGQLLQQDGSDAYVAAAAVSSLGHRNLTNVLEVVLAAPGEVPPGALENLLRTAWGLREARAMELLAGYLTEARPGRSEAALFAGVAAWLDAVEQAKKGPSQSADTALRPGLDRLRPVLAAARRAASDARAPGADRVQAVRLLGRGSDHQREDRETLARLLSPLEPETLQAAAATALAQLADPEAPAALLQGWKGQTPAVRARVLEALLGRADGPRTLLEALENKRILPQDFSPAGRRRLVDHPVREVRDRAARVFTDRIDPDRDRIVTSYQPALALKGDSERGRQLFGKHCATCHRLGGVGNAVGPDLAMVRDKPADWFLPALFDPSRAVEARYLNYVATTRDGKVFTGVLAEESGNQLTLIGPTGQTQTLLRANLEELYSTGKSAMPDGLEKELKHQDAADLVAYLRSPK